MVKIKRGSHEIRVSKSSYEYTFKPLGYTLVEEKKAVKEEMPKVVVENKAEDKTEKVKK